MIKMDKQVKTLEEMATASTLVTGAKVQSLPSATSNHSSSLKGKSLNY